MTITFQTVFHIIASFFIAIAVLLIFASPHELAGHGWLEWTVIGLLFHSIGHWIPGHLNG